VVDWSVFWSAAVALSLLAWLAKVLAKLLINRDIERYKSELNSQMAGFKAQLERENLEHEVRFKRVDKRIANALSEVFGAVNDLLDTLCQYLQPGGAPEQSSKAFAETRRQFENIFFRKRRLYIPPDLFQKVNGLYRNTIEIADRFRGALRRVEKAADTQEDQHLWTEAIERLNSEAEPLLVQIVLEFQTRIGVVIAAREIGRPLTDNPPSNPTAGDGPLTGR
jgi:hypothetical protein